MSDAVQRAPQTTEQTTFDRILVPLDGSEAAEAAVAFAAQIPARELCLLHVDTDDDVFVPEWVTNPDAARDDAPARDELEHLAKQLRKAGHTVETLVQVGDVAEEIIFAAQSADLVVMTTRGRGAAGRLLFGSVADRVMRHGNTPTLLLRAGAHTEQIPMPTRIVVPLDGSAESEQALPEAVRMGWALGLPILLLRAVGLDEVRAELRQQRKQGEAPFEISPDRYEQARLATRDEAERYLAAHIGRLRSLGLTAESAVADGDAAFSLLWTITPEDLVVMTTHGRSGYQRWSVGSVAEKLVREAPCPVLIQRRREADDDR